MGVLRQLGYDTPDPEVLTRAVFDASAKIKEAHGMDLKDCLVLVPVNSEWYKNGVRENVDPPQKQLGV
ncbi:hypothetical protein [Sinosporangium siamense]|nr:hypothetical protein [Sinosporangium siamense]